MLLLKLTRVSQLLSVDRITAEYHQSAALWAADQTFHADCRQRPAGGACAAGLPLVPYRAQVQHLEAGPRAASLQS